MRIASFLVALTMAGAALGAGPREGGILLIHDFATKPFSMENEIDPIAILLSRFSPDIQRRTAKEATIADLEKAGSIVVAGIAGFPPLSPACLDYLQKTQKPLVGIGAAASLATIILSISTSMVVSASPAPSTCDSTALSRNSASSHSIRHRWLSR